MNSYSAAEERRVAVRLKRACLAIPALTLIATLAWPLFFSTSIFAGDWLTQLWFIWKQSMAIRASHLPSLFLSYPHGVFYPQYAFYGGTLYALIGTLSLVLGDAPIQTYVLTYLLGFLAAYGGWYWLARSFGLGGWIGQVPGLIFITSSYYLTLIYARGDWPEFIAVSMIPLMIASGLSVVRTRQLRMGSALAFTVSCTFFFGSHNLTVVWASTLIALLAVTVVVCVPQARKAITPGGLLRLVRLAIPAMLLSAWFLLPAAAYESSTSIANRYPAWQAWLRETMGLVSAHHLFTLSRATVLTPGTDFALSLPVLAMGWTGAIAIFVLRHGLRSPWARMILICATLTAAVTVLMTHAELILTLPRFYSTLQFSYRLESYFLLALSATVLAVLALMRSESPHLRRWLLWPLLPILATGIVGAIQQVSAYPPSKDRGYAFSTMYQSADASGEPLVDYLDVRQPTVTDPMERAFAVNFDTTSPQDTRLAEVVDLTPGELVDSNLLAPPPLVHVAGARIAGINPRDGSDVLEVAPPPGSAAGTKASPGIEVISVTPADSLPVLLGRLLTLCGAGMLAIQFALLASRKLRSRATVAPSARGPSAPSAR